MSKSNKKPFLRKLFVYDQKSSVPLRNFSAHWYSIVSFLTTIITLLIVLKKFVKYLSKIM